MILYEDILESLPDGIIGVDKALNIRTFNLAAETLCEISRTAAIGRPLKVIFPKDPKFIDSISSTMLKGRLLTDAHQTLSRRFSGSVPIGITTSTIIKRDGTVIGAVAILKDRSGIKAIESSSLRKERLAYLGTFAANLAHEIKNPLGGLRGAAQLITRKTDDALLTEYAQLVIQEADRLNSIVESMLNFARPARLSTKELNIHQLLDSTTTLLSGSGAEILRIYDPSLPCLSGDSASLKQVFINLIKNGIEATSGTGRPGRVTVETRMVTDFHMPVIEEQRQERHGQMAAVLIGDNGTGIKEEDMENIFTPFFTTKSKGSGLGMALSLKIVREHHGRIKIDSIEGSGTTVTVYLPTSVKNKDRAGL